MSRRIDYGKYGGPHYWTYFHTRKFGDDVVGAHHLLAHINWHQSRCCKLHCFTGLKNNVQLKTSRNLGGRGGCIISRAWQMQLGLHTISYMGHTIRLPKVTYTIHLPTLFTIISVVSESFLLVNWWKNLNRKFCNGMESWRPRIGAAFRRDHAVTRDSQTRISAFILS